MAYQDTHCLSIPPLNIIESHWYTVDIPFVQQYALCPSKETPSRRDSVTIWLRYLQITLPYPAHHRQPKKWAEWRTKAITKPSKRSQDSWSEETPQIMHLPSWSKNPTRAEDLRKQKPSTGLGKNTCWDRTAIKSPPMVRKRTTVP
jgi:hypothetical protein